MQKLLLLRGAAHNFCGFAILICKWLDLRCSSVCSSSQLMDPTESPVTPSGNALLNSNKIWQQQRQHRLSASALTTGSPDLLGCDWSWQMNKHLSHPSVLADTWTTIEVCINNRPTGSTWQINGIEWLQSMWPPHSKSTIVFLKMAKVKNITAF